MHIVAFNRYWMDVEVMNGGCLVMYGNMVFQFFAVRVSLLYILTRFIRCCEFFGGRSTQHDWFPDDNPRDHLVLFILPKTPGEMETLFSKTPPLLGGLF